MTLVAAQLDEIRRTVHRRVLNETQGGLTGPALRRVVVQLVGEVAPVLDGPTRATLVAACLDDISGLGPLERVLADPSVTEILYNGHGRMFIERDGRLAGIDLGMTDADVVRIVQRIVAPLGLRLDRTAPIVDARLPDGSRVHAVVPPLAVDGPCVCIRRFPNRKIALDRFGVTAAAQALLEAMVRSGWNMVVSGGTSSGKTTLLNALAGAIPPDERIVTIEETAELQLAHPHVVRLESRPAGVEGVGAIGVRDLVRTALRMRPDRIVVGEVRGAEAFDMLQACNTGHNGSLSTLHANTAHDALVRLEALANMAGVPGSSRSHIRSGIDAVIQVARTRTGARRITEIAALGGTSSELQLIALSKPTIDGCDAIGPLPTRASRNGG